VRLEGSEVVDSSANPKTRKPENPSPLIELTLRGRTAEQRFNLPAPSSLESVRLSADEAGRALWFVTMPTLSSSAASHLEMGVHYVFVFVAGFGLGATEDRPTSSGYDIISMFFHCVSATTRDRRDIES
jgi:hypothetical protein